MARILIVDDQAIVRAGYRHFLDQAADITEVGEAASASEALSKLQTDRWDVVMLAMQIAQQSGLAALSQIRRAHPKVRVLMVSGLPERDYARITIQAGASGYLPKSSSAPVVLEAIRSVVAGRHYVSAELVQIMASELDRVSGEPLHACLSKREFEVFLRLANGIGVSAIAASLGLSVKTVSTYRTRILAKTPFKTNSDMTAYALRNNITTASPSTDGISLARKEPRSQRAQ
jgi:two-component system, NarL family, invasion response regulator UvrY